MSFPAYPIYKESGVEWLGEVPTHWSVHRISELYREVGELGHDELPILSVSIHDGVSEDEAGPDDGGRTVNRSDDRSKYKQVRPNDLVYNMMRAWQGGFGSVKVLGMVSPAYIVARPRNDVPSALVELILRTAGAIEEMRRRSKGVTDFRLRLDWDEFKDMRIALPPAREQLDIINFLGRETAKIDALVEEQRRLIALLKEKRQAVISHAVTKGLNSDALMRESGVEWLGEVPKHWEVKKFSRAVDYQEGPGIMAADFRDEGVPLMRVAGASGRWASLEGCNFLDPDKVMVRWDHFRLELGDLIISGSASMGTVCEVGTDVIGSIAYTGLIRLRPLDGETTRDFLRAYVHSSVFFTQVEMLKAGATIQHFGPTHLRGMLMPLPPLAEQQTIAAHIDRVNAQYDELMGEAELAIALLGERRAALISAAVTGKVDVRGAAHVLPFPVDRARVRGLVASEIIERSAHQATFGRVKLQKIAYLAEIHAGVTELEGAYLREAAGPLDREMIREMEREAGALAGVRVEQPAGVGSAVTYRLGDLRGAHRQDLAALLGDRAAKFHGLIEDIATIDTKGAEAVATLYAVWNDALIDGEIPADIEIQLSVLSEWHPEKAKKFTISELQIWLDWMRRHALVPVGTGPKTATGRLFA